MGKIKASNNQSSSSSDEQSLADSLLTNNKSSAGTEIEKTPDPQVNPKRSYSARRSFSATYKQTILKNYEACSTAQERGELLRREGLYHSQICTWRSQRAAGKLNAAKKGKHNVRTDHLARENEQLKKRLAQAEAIIELQKKVSDLLGMHILPHEKSETKS